LLSIIPAGEYGGRKEDDEDADANADDNDDDNDDKRMWL
jgi:hypothetical protein